MSGTNRLQVVADAVAEAGLLEEVEPSEVLEILGNTDIDLNDAKKLAQTIAYTRHRFIFKKSRYEAFRLAFPERSVYSGKEGSDMFQAGGAEGEDLPKASINMKAKRLEDSAIYKKVIAILQTNMYVSYAISRMEVLDIALDKIKDDYVADRDKVAYMKVFLEETRKPESAKGMEVNVNVQNNEVNLVSIEEKLSNIADKMVGAHADQIIEALNGDSK
jgi:hypothetical protein